MRDRIHPPNVKKQRFYFRFCKKNSISEVVSLFFCIFAANFKDNGL